jgi:hypothetical protein
VSDHPGDPAKQPAGCESVFTRWGPENPKPSWGVGEGHWSQCPNLKTIREGWESETIACDVCGKRYTLYDDEMR